MDRKPASLSDIAITIPATKHSVTNPSASELSPSAPTIVQSSSAKGLVPLVPSAKRGVDHITLSVNHDYRVAREIARGGMGVIYEGVDPLLGRSVALKISSLAHNDGDPRFKQEAEVLAALAHPNIVPIHGFGSDINGAPFYSMKLIKGRTLQSVIESLKTEAAATPSNYPLSKRLDVFRKACDALSFAHDQGFIHRDLKPDNIMVGEYGEVLVMDWGLAKRIGAPELRSQSRNANSPIDHSAFDAGMTLEGDVIGTPQYMAPEQAEGRVSDLDERSDVYSLGGILFALLALRPPIEGSSLDEVLGNVKSGRISSLTTRRSKSVVSRKSAPGLDRSIPEPLRAVTMKALAFAPEDRYPSVQALAADIDAYLSGFATQAEQAGVLRKTALLIKRHKSISALAALLLTGGITFTIRLAASERKAIAEHALAQQSNANALTSLAEVADERLDGEQMEDLLEKVPKKLRTPIWDYLWQRLHPHKVSAESKPSTKWTSVQAHPTRPNIFVALQSDGLLSEVDAETGAVSPILESKAANRGAVGFSISKDGKTIAIAKTASKPGGNATEILIFPAEKPNPKKPTSQFAVPFTIGPFAGSRFGLSLNREGQLIVISSSQKLRDTNDFAVQLFNTTNGELKWSNTHNNLSYVEFTSKNAIMALTDREGVREMDVNSGKITHLADQSLFPTNLSNRLLFSADMDWERTFTLKSNNVIRSVSAKDGTPLLSLPIGSEASQLQSLTVDRRGYLWTVRRISRQSSALESWDREGKPEMGYPLLSGRQGIWQIVPHPLSDQLCAIKDTDLHIIRLGDAPTLPNATQKPPLNVSGLVSSKTRGSTTYLHSRDKQLFLRTESGASDKTPKESLLLDLSNDPARRTFLHSNAEGSEITVIQETAQRPKTLIVRYKMQDGLAVEDKRSICDLPGWWPKALIPSADGKHLWTGQSLLDLESHQIESMIQSEKLRYEGDSPERIASLAAWTSPAQIVQIMSVFDPDEDDDDGWHDVIACIEIPTGKIVKLEHASSASSLSASPDGKWVAESGTDRRVRIRHSDSLAVEREFLAHESRVRRVIWHPSKPALITLGDDRRVKIIHSETGKVLEEIWNPKQAFSGMKLSEDGTQVLLNTSPTISVWEPAALKAQ
jgi:serine/threonine protein kinase